MFIFMFSLILFFYNLPSYSHDEFSLQILLACKNQVHENNEDLFLSYSDNIDIIDISTKNKVGFSRFVPNFFLSCMFFFISFLSKNLNFVFWLGAQLYMCICIYQENKLHKTYRFTYDTLRLYTVLLKYWLFHAKINLNS